MQANQIEKIQSWLKNHESELLDHVQSIIRIPSVQGPALPGARFGEPVRDALNYVLELGNRWEMKTKDLDGYACYAEIGQGKNLVLCLSHVDVVPVGSGWNFDPFGAEIKDDYLYGRGTVDDKGPAIASFYAMRAIQECCPDLKARIRCVFGGNEESGFECVKHYVQTEELPTYGITPDGDWPLVYAEKGIAALYIDIPAESSAFELISIEGGEAINVVMNSCRATVRVARSIRHEIEMNLGEAWDKNVSWNWDDNLLHIEAKGRGAHGSTPFLGDSAAIRLLRFLVEIAPVQASKFYQDLFALSENTGAGLGILGSDEVSRDLTSNLGVIRSKDNTITFQFNIRYPVTWKGEQLVDRCNAHLAEACSSFKLSHFDDSPPMYIPKEHPLVKTICDVYTEETGENLKPKVIGGGTYARAIPNTVSIGTGWQGDRNVHSFDERIKVDHLFKLSRIYAHVLYRLAQLD
jgi:succinyl-diaminopimelate desuccinylase